VLPYSRSFGRAVMLAAAAVAAAGSSALAQHAPKAAQVQIAPSDAKVAVGAQTPFVATAYDAAGNPLDEATFVWSSSNPAVASIDQSGIATGRSPGLAIITARTGTGSAEKSAQVPIEVTAAAPVAQPRPPVTAPGAASAPAPTPTRPAVTPQAAGSSPPRVQTQRTATTSGTPASADSVRHACDGGAASACADLGMMYESGKGVPASLDSARALGQRGCDGGDGRACRGLGAMYAEGRGVTRDYGKAATLFQRGCDLGTAHSCTAAGLLYQRGLGVQRDVAHARQLFQRACQGRDPQGCAWLRRTARGAQQSAPSPAP